MCSLLLWVEKNSEDNKSALACTWFHPSADDAAFVNRGPIPNVETVLATVMDATKHADRTDDGAVATFNWQAHGE